MNNSDNMSLRVLTNRERLRIISFSILSALILIMSLTFFALSFGKPYIGAYLSLGSKGWEVQDVDTGGLAKQAGMKQGDKPVEVNGQPADTFLEKYEKVGLFYGSLIKELTVVGDQGNLKSASLENSTTSWLTDTEMIALFIVCLIFWLIGAYVFFKRPNNLAAQLLFLCWMAVGLVLSANMAALRAVPAAVFFEVVVTVIGPWMLLHFFIILPEERKGISHNPLIYLVYLIPAVTLVLFLLVGFAEGEPLPSFRNFRFLGYGLGFLAIIVVAFLNYYRAVFPRTRQQMKIVLMGCLATFIPFLFLFIIPEAIWRRPIIPANWNVLLFVFIPLSIGYAVMKQKLLDIDVIIRRSVVYGLITLFMAIILSVALFLVINIQHAVGTPEQVLTALVMGGVATALFGPAKRCTEYTVDKIFYKDRYDYRQIIQGLNTSLNTLKDLGDIPRLVVGTVVQTLNLCGGCLFIKFPSRDYQLITAQGTFANDAKQTQLLSLLSRRTPAIEFPNSAGTLDPDLEFIIPLVAGGKEVGVLCLSSKVSRQNFSSDDIYLLQGVASLAAVSMRNAMLARDVSLRDTFVSIASHELRTPLTAIMGYSDLLLHRNVPEVVRTQWVNNILEHGQTLTDMVDELLNVSRIHSGKVVMKMEAVKASDIFKERLAMVLGNSPDHQFTTHVEPDLPEALVDRDKFGQVITNLLSNAIKYSPNGGTITLSAWKSSQQDSIIFSVADEGIGISPEDQESLFTTFHRIYRPETEGVRGSGLGLYIVKEWTQAMGGKIWLESELNKGSTFYISVPVAGSDTLSTSSLPLAKGD
jgi:nitrogen-specific signal transduction histidine kinase